MNIKSLSIDGILLFVCIVLTYITQIPAILENGNGEFFLLVWVFPLLRILFSNKFFLDKWSLRAIMLYVLFVLMVFVMEYFIKKSYFDSIHLKNLTLQTGMVLIGYYWSDFICYKNLRKSMAWASLVGGLILTYTIFNSSFENLINIESREYGYTAKNSASQILLTALIFSVILFNDINSFFNVLKVFFIAFCIYVIMLMKSRATILGFVFFIVFLIFFSKNKMLKRYLSISVLFFLFLLFFDPQFRTLFLDGIIFSLRDPSDLNDLSSGRIDQIVLFPSYFITRPFFGHGPLFIESFPLSLLVELGIIGSFPVFIFLFKPVIFLVKSFDKESHLILIFFLLVITYYLNGFFEQQAPLGPGAKCFMLWLLFGILSRKSNRQFIDIIN